MSCILAASAMTLEVSHHALYNGVTLIGGGVVVGLLQTFFFSSHRESCCFETFYKNLVICLLYQI
jgi:hypothetical protein